MDLVLRIQIGNLATLRRRRSLRLAGDAIYRWSAINQNFNGPQAKKILEELVNGSADYGGIKNRINSTGGRINLLDLEIPF